MRRYEQYAPSGFDWLGDLPSHWSILRAKYVLREIDDRSVAGDEELLSVSHLTGVTPRSEKNVTMFMAEDYTGAKLCKDGDLVINTMWAWMGALGVSSSTGIVSPAYGVYRQLEQRLRPRYMDWLFRTPMYVAEYTRRSTGVNSSRLRLYPDQFLDMPVVLPPLEDQDRIVTFLDQKAAEIDEAIAKKERLIDLLLDQQSALIDSAMLHGIRQGRMQTPSGLDWIGCIPEGWTVVPITKYIHSIVDYRGKTPEKVDSGIFLVTAKNIKNGRIDYAASEEFVSEKEYPKIMARGLPEVGDLLFTTEAPLGEVALVDRVDVAFAQRIIKLRLRQERLHPRFVVHAMRAQYFQSLLAREATGSTAQGIKASKLHKLKIAAPPVDEQEEIASYLDEVVQKIFALVAHAKKEIEIFRELKVGFVAATVTGRIKV